MFLTMNNQHIIQALKNTMLFSASTHLILLIIRAIQTADYTLLNMFNILDINLYLPHLTQGIPNFFLSQIVIVVIFLFFFQRARRLQ